MKSRCLSWWVLEQHGPKSQNSKSSELQASITTSSKSSSKLARGWSTEHCQAIFWNLFPNKSATGHCKRSFDQNSFYSCYLRKFFAWRSIIIWYVHACLSRAPRLLYGKQDERKKREGLSAQEGSQREGFLLLWHFGQKHRQKVSLIYFKNRLLYEKWAHRARTVNGSGRIARGEPRRSWIPKTSEKRRINSKGRKKVNFGKFSR